MLAKSKLNSIDTLISQALIDTDISHEEFITILKEKERYENRIENRMKLWGLIVRNQRFRKKIFFLCIYKSEILLSFLCW